METVRSWSQRLLWVILLLVLVAFSSCHEGRRAVVFGQRSIDSDLRQLLGRCKLHNSAFDECMKDVFNELRTYFQSGVPEYGINPFDPHRCTFVELRRGDQNKFGFKLILRNVSEYGWSQSEVTNFQTDLSQNQIIYSQYFPEKSLNGYYEFVGKLLGKPIKRHGFWNLTLYDYSQTTSVRRLGPEGSILKVHVEVDRIGGMRMHIGNFLEGRLNSVSDGFINSMWPIGLPFLKPIINELVSTAFTDIFNESFRHFSLDKFIS